MTPSPSGAAPAAASRRRSRFLFGRWVNIDLEMRRVDWTLRHLTVARQPGSPGAATLLGDVATLRGVAPRTPVSRSPLNNAPATPFNPLTSHGRKDPSPNY
ncbi:hypothetical protein MTP99_006288 [Tenebrio molitor]|nr:hypothetical protein MTP99_006288 [Tenebrio molitor]